MPDEWDPHKANGARPFPAGCASALTRRSSASWVSKLRAGAALSLASCSSGRSVSARGTVLRGAGAYVLIIRHFTLNEQHYAEAIRRKAHCIKNVCGYHRPLHRSYIASLYTPKRASCPKGTPISSQSRERSLDEKCPHPSLECGQTLFPCRASAKW